MIAGRLLLHARGFSKFRQVLGVRFRKHGRDRFKDLLHQVEWSKYSNMADINDMKAGQHDPWPGLSQFSRGRSGRRSKWPVLFVTTVSP